MDPPQYLGAAEECHSSESGWTMYIGSPVEDEENDHSDLPNRVITDEEFDEDDERIHCDDNSDDSMASDASSGLSHREQSLEIQKGGSDGGDRGRGRDSTADQYNKNKEVKQYENNHCSSNYKNKGSSLKKNRSYVKGNEEKGAEGAEYLVHSSKVRKSHWMGKRK